MGRMGSLPHQRRFCHSHCTGISAWFRSCCHSRAFDRKILAPCPPWAAKTKKYARKASGLFPVPDDLRALYIRFSRRILRAFVMPSFLVRVFAKPPSGSFPEGGCVGVLILMRLGLAGGYDFSL